VAPANRGEITKSPSGLLFAAQARREYKEPMSKSALGIILIIVALFGLIFFLNTKKSSSGSGEKTYAVTIRPNEQDKTLFDIVLIDPSIPIPVDPKDKSNESLFATTANVFAGHYHAAEYHNGNVYIIKRVGFENGQPIDQNWTDELWKFGADKREAKIFSAKGLDFRFSVDEKHGAVFFADPASTPEQGILDIAMIDKNGRISETLTSQTMGLTQYGLSIFPLFWSDDTLWITSGNGPEISVVSSIDASSKYKINSYDVSGMKIQGLEFSLNPDKMLIAFSDMPIILDEASAKKFTASKQAVTLYTYDLKTKEKQTISSSVAKPFMPAWFDPKTLEFNDPNGEGRVTKVLD